MTGIAMIQSRIGTIESRMAELGVGQQQASTGGNFAGVLGELTTAAANGETSTRKIWGYVAPGTKLASVPGTQAYAQAQAEAAAAAAAAREAAARQAAEQQAARQAATAERTQAATVERTQTATAERTQAAAPAAPGGRSASTTAAAAVSATSNAAPAPALSAPASSGGLTGSQVVATAKKYLGVPYKWGGATRAGMDCSGLVQRTFLDHGIKLPRTARGLMSAGTAVPSLAQAQPGDLIITRSGGHVAIYLGNNEIIHAPQPGTVVRTQRNYSTDATIDTIRRIV